MGTTVLLTGATGFLGAHLARELLARKYKLRVLVRSGSGCQLLNGLPLAYFEGDVLDGKSVMRAMQGCNAVIHAAALTQVNPARSPLIWAVNKTGTEHVIQAAQSAGVNRLVYVGTANVFGFGTLEQPGNEASPFMEHNYGLDYINSKRAASQIIEQAVLTTHLPAVLVHPTFMLGPLDAKPSSGRMLLELYEGRVIGYPMGGKNFVHVRDVAVATVNALTQGRIGESYILGHQNLSYQEAFSQMAHSMGVKPPRWPISPGLARLYGKGLDLWTGLTGFPVRLNSAMIAVANDGHYFNSRKAITELGLPQTSITSAIKEAFDWFEHTHYVKKRVGK